jgi:hypothetical protein
LPKPRHDKLLAALIAKLPPSAAPWERVERIAWLRMMAMAFDVVYGACTAVPIAPGELRVLSGPCDDAAATSGACGKTSMAGGGSAGDGVGYARGRAGSAIATLTASPSAIALSQPTSLRFYVDQDGFAMGDGEPIAMEDLPEGATLWDERSGLECGDLTTVLWRDIGTTRRSLPRGVILKAATAAA